MNPMDTIAGIATAQGEGGVAILRVSGTGAQEIMRAAFIPGRKYAQGRIQTHRLYYGHLVDARGDVLDEVMAVLMRAPHSYTREDVLEIHCHGGRAAVGRALRRALELGARAAEPGEFTRRAFVNGRVDLSEAEAVMGLISARTDAAYRAAMRQLEGGVSAFVRQCREELLAIMARIEAANDFPEEMDEATEALEAAREARRVAGELLSHSDARAARIVREGASAVLAGRPNVGKSSLMNALVGSERAIVTEYEGTTRDVLTERMEMDGVLLELSDTAGQRETDNAIEAMGVRRAERAVELADMVLLVMDASEGLTAEDRALLEKRDGRYLLVWNKCDLMGEGRPGEGICVSARTGEGLETLKRAMRERVDACLSGEEILTQERHIEAARRAATSLCEAARAMEAGYPLDVASVDLWDAIRALGEITGEDATEALIEEIFARFCVGK